MSNDQLVVDLKRLGVELRVLKRDLRKQYANPQLQVTSPPLTSRIATIAESWISNFSHRAEVTVTVSEDYLADLTVHFQRLLTFSERATVRKRYDKEIKDVLKNYTADLVVPIMRGSSEPSSSLQNRAPNNPRSAWTLEELLPFEPTAFVGHSFETNDQGVVKSAITVLEAIGIRVATGEKPKADTISNKVKRLIEEQYLFVGIFTRRDKISGKEKWTTSAWVIDEKAYAHAKNRVLILIVEDGVESIGGIQGDYEYLRFTRENLHEMIERLLQLFKVRVEGLLA